MVQEKNLVIFIKEMFNIEYVNFTIPVIRLTSKKTNKCYQYALLPGVKEVIESDGILPNGYMKNVFTILYNEYILLERKENLKKLLD